MGTRRHCKQRHDSLHRSQEISKGEVDLNASQHSSYTRKTSNVFDRHNGKSYTLLD